MHTKQAWLYLISFWLLGISFTLGGVKPPLKVVALHPLIADLTKQVGGKQVKVVSLMKGSDNPHDFNPTPADLHKTRGAQIYFASGMGMETYLEKLSDTLGNSARLVEVGKTLPTRELHSEHQCSNHDSGCNHSGNIDPHWWHDISNMKRAADIICKTLTQANPEQAAVYQQNKISYQKDLTKLHSWIRRQLINIPYKERKLATAHAAFGYFCDAYDFTPLAVQGISKNSEPSAVELAEIVQTIRDENIKAIFPEQRSNPKALKALSEEAGINIGGTLIADGSSSYVEMMKHNVKTIITGLK